MSVFAIPYCDPLQAFWAWADQPWAQLLDCPADDPLRGRYAYIAIDPYATVISVDNHCLVDGVAVADDPFTALENLLKQAPPPLSDCPTPFGGGAVGLMGYELGRHLERAPARHRLSAGEPEMAVGLYDMVVAFDRLAQKAWVIGVGLPGEAKAQQVVGELARRGALPPLSAATPLVVEAEMSRQSYLDAVARVIEYIRAGDIFQANFTLRFLADRPADWDEFALYRRLRAVNPAPFAAFLKLPGLTLASASPERFLSLSREGLIEARPIKGTMPRHREPEQDRALAQQLLHSVKDRAENLMIVDLLRNDIGRVAAIGSIKVPVLSGIESFANVHHLVSVISGKLRPGLGAVDLLRASFPGGSITGAPKVRAMEIIDELEVAPRSAYCGSVMWIGFDGAMDSNIVIRSIIMAGGKVITQAGGGIVADSVPELEWDEMMTKVAPALKSLAG
jgi:para-aminobenzoate synthetase component I